MMAAERVDDPYLEQVLEQVRSSEQARQATLVDLRVGPFWTVVRTSIGAGMASTATYDLQPCGRHPIADAGTLHQRCALDLAELCRSPSAPEAAIGLAALNALLPYPAGTVTEASAEAVIRQHCRHGRVAIIGHFPFAERLKPDCPDVTVFERGSRLQEGDLPAEQMAAVLPAAAVVAISATTLINHTLDRIMALVSPDAFVLMLGPSTPMTPVLHELGFAALCGTWLGDGRAALLAASQGAVLKQIHDGQRLIFWRPGLP